jgi:hypothetical protein
MAKSLKEQNTWTLWLIVAANALVFYTILSTGEIKLDGLSGLMRQIPTLIPIGIAGVIATVLNALPSADLKRDYTALSCFFLIVFGPWALIFMTDKWVAAGYVGSLVLQYALVRQGAANAGIRMVTNVGDIAEVVGLADLHDVHRGTFAPGCRQLQNPLHAPPRLI